MIIVQKIVVYTLSYQYLYLWKIFIIRKYMLSYKFLSVLVLLSFSTIMPALAFGAPIQQSAENWENMNGDTWAWNYSPQTQITKDNVNNLEVKWIFPLEGVANGGTASMIDAINPRDGSSTPPLVVDGTIIIATNYLKIYGINAVTGKQLWGHTYEINVTEVTDRIPIRHASFGGVHNHGFRYWANGNAVINRGIACDFYGVDATTGEESFWIKDLCKDVPGNRYLYHTVYSGTKAGSIAIHEKTNQFIYVLSGAVHSTAYDGDGRHATMGIDTRTHEILWRVYSYPPHGVLSKDWALQECDTGWFRDIPCSTVAAQAPENLEWDWAFPNEAPSLFGGVTANWGQMVMDEDTGLMYTQTGNQGPYTRIGETPGPRLYGSTIMAIDVVTGMRVWWSQPMPRDPYDYDCNWSGILAEVPNLGKIYMKGCKEGLLHIFNAATGEPIRIHDIIEDQVSWGQISDAALTEPPEGGVRYHTMDPLSFYDMREMPSPDHSRYCPEACDVYPAWTNGIFQTDMSYDPETYTLFHYAGGLQTKIINSPPAEIGVRSSITESNGIRNVTLVARDVITGEVKWTYYYDTSAQRSHIVVSPGLVFAGFTDGYLRFFDSSNGNLVREMNLGTHMVNGFTTGQDENGDQKLFGIVGVGRATKASVYPSPNAPGTLIALGLSETAAQAVTVTQTSTSVSTSTIATTNTVSVTEEVGISSTVTYAAIAIAVIAVIAAAVLTQRKN